MNDEKYLYELGLKRLCNEGYNGSAGNIKDYVDVLEQCIAELEAALTKIANWELPQLKDRNGVNVSYGSQYGPGGERHFMRLVAQQGLSRRRE